MKNSIFISILLALHLAMFSCKDSQNKQAKETVNPLQDSNLKYVAYTPRPTDLIISRADYADKLYGFWLGECIANWTGLVI